MSKFRNVTVVSVAGQGDGQNAVYAISRSVAELPGSKGLLLAARKPAIFPDEIEYRKIEGFGYQQYMLFVFHCLYYHIDTEFALIVQDDGWVLNGSNWDDIWFEYDFVGGICYAAGRRAGNTDRPPTATTPYPSRYGKRCFSRCAA